MFVLKYFAVLIISSACVLCDDTEQMDNETTSMKPSEADIQLTTLQANTSTEIEKVVVEVYYESLCPFCKEFFVETLEPEIPSMHQYLDIRLYPYGNAYTTEVNGKYVFDCQHGESECYGNKLHACAIDILKNVTKSTLFNSCLMDWYSNDKGVDECAKWQKVDGNPVKECAKSDKGHQLLKYYGDESKKVYYPGVPYVLINGVYKRWRRFKTNVCTTFNHPPPPCNSVKTES